MNLDVLIALWWGVEALCAHTQAYIYLGAVVLSSGYWGSSIPTFIASLPVYTPTDIEQALFFPYIPTVFVAVCFVGASYSD